MRFWSNNKVKARDKAIEARTEVDFIICFAAMAACAVVTENIKTIKSTELVEAICKLDAEMWAAFGNGNPNPAAPITTEQLGIMLEVFGIKSEPISFESGTENGYYCRDIGRVANNYCSIPISC